MINFKISATLVGSICFFTAFHEAVQRQYSMTYYFIRDDQQCKQTVANKVCIQGGPGCLGTEGESLGRQLYRDDLCTLPLKEE